ncbi:MAG: PHB depolymerase family esterase [Candidatus Omnitrophota bacterium]
MWFFALTSVSGNAEVLKKETQKFVYYLLVPSSYNSAQSWPLIITLHPSTGRGNMMVDYLTEQAEKKGYIVAGPDSQDSKTWYFSESEDIFRMIDDIKAKYRIDEKRIFLTGFSSGAGMAYYLGLNYPQKFRAIAPFAGPFKQKEIDGRIDMSSDQSRHIPVLILHGKNDNTLDFSESVYAKERLGKFGYEVKLRELGGIGHEYPPEASWIIINWFDKMK